MLYHCFTCKKVAPLNAEDEKKCALCGSSNGEVVTRQRLEKGMAAGGYYNIDPKTGKRAKVKKR